MPERISGLDSAYAHFPALEQLVERVYQLEAIVESGTSIGSDATFDAASETSGTETGAIGTETAPRGTSEALERIGELEQSLVELDRRVALLGQPLADTVEHVATIAAQPVYAELHPQLAMALDLLVSQVRTYAGEQAQQRDQLAALTRWAGNAARRLAELDAMKGLE